MPKSNVHSPMLHSIPASAVSSFVVTFRLKSSYFSAGARREQTHYRIPLFILRDSGRGMFKLDDLDSDMDEAREIFAVYSVADPSILQHYLEIVAKYRLSGSTIQQARSFAETDLAGIHALPSMALKTYPYYWLKQFEAAKYHPGSRLAVTDRPPSYYLGGGI